MGWGKVAEVGKNLRSYSIEGIVDSNNSLKFYFKTEGSSPTVYLAIKGEQFPVRFYTELGQHTHIFTGTAHGHTASSSVVPTTTHTHSVSGTSGVGSAHSHSISIISGAGSSHYHAVSITSGAGSSHGHSVSITSGNQSGGHTHTWSDTSSGQSADHQHSYNPGALPVAFTGGTSNDHFHDVSGTTSDISASHTHNVSGNSGNEGSHTHGVSGYSENESAHTHGVSGTSGSESAHTHSFSATSGTPSATAAPTITVANATAGGTNANAGVSGGTLSTVQKQYGESLTVTIDSTAVTSNILTATGWAAIGDGTSGHAFHTTGSGEMNASAWATYAAGLHIITIAEPTAERGCRTLCHLEAY